jgi:serine/threonine protein phosphatase PrpC
MATGRDATATAIELVDAALAHGARDNVTVVVIDVVGVNLADAGQVEGDTLPQKSIR